MSRAPRYTLLLLGALLASPTLAQPAEPRGPRDIIAGAQKARAQREMVQATSRGAGGAAAAAPPAPTAPRAEAVQNPHAGLDPHGGAGPHGGPAAHPGMAADGAPPPIATERPAPALPTGTIEVRVFEPTGAPAPAAEVSLGIMNADGSRASKPGRADANGVARFSDLPFGDKQAYRVNAPYQGARYSSMPFRLPHQGGYQVEIHRLPVTHDARMIVLYVGATSIELKDDRLKVVQQSRLLNLGGATYVFPEEGTLVRLPAGFMAVQTEDVMTDQKVVEAKGEGLRVSGSLPPGEVTLMWGFDLPLEGTEASFRVDVPWLVFAYRVISDAPAGIKLTVQDMPEPVLHEDEGRRMLVTEMQRKVGDQPFTSVRVALAGIPGPGPGRWIAAAVALLALALGVFASLRGAKTAPAATLEAELEARKAALLDRVRKLDAEHAEGEVGPQYHREQLARITDELAAVLREAALAGEPRGEPR